MGRPRQKSKNEILDACRDTFWRHGYYNTSIKDIESATGLKPGSVYHQFKNKENIYQQTLAYYIDTVIQPRATQYLFATEGDARKNIIEFFESIFQINMNNRHGCLMVNAASESSGQVWLHKLLTDMIDLIERGFLFQLDRIEDYDESRLMDKQLVARQLALINQGFWSMVRIDGSNQILEKYIDSIKHLVR